MKVAGLRFGLEGERRSQCGLFAYGKTAASLLGGVFRTNYLQLQEGAELSQAETAWKQGRFVTILDAELGLGWASSGGHFKGSVGYTVSGWLNMVKTGDFISSVQANKYNGPDKLGDTSLTFDGLTGRIELMW